MPKTTSYFDPRNNAFSISTMFEMLEMPDISGRIVEYAYKEVAKGIAEQFLAQHAQDILKHLDPQAVANLAIADAAGHIRETLEKKLPDKILEVVRTDTQVYQKGLFGGLKRIG